MSRVGKSPIPVPSGVEVAINGRMVSAKGKLGQLAFETHELVTTALENGEVSVKPIDESKAASAMWGTTRARINNMVVGVSEGFRKGLEITGTGYRAAVQGKKRSTCSSATATTSTIRFPRESRSKAKSPPAWW